MCVCTCVQVWESYYGMAKYVHIYLFPILIHLLLCHPESCPVMYHEICNRWDLGQSRSFMVPCHTWDSPARQVVLKTWVIHRNGSTAVSEHHPKIGKTFRWAGSFKFPRNFHQPQRRGNISEGQHGTKHSLGFSHPGRLASILYFFLPSYSPGLTHPLPVCHLLIQFQASGGTALVHSDCAVVRSQMPHFPVPINSFLMGGQKENQDLG